MDLEQIRVQEQSIRAKNMKARQKLFFMITVMEDCLKTAQELLIEQHTQIEETFAKLNADVEKVQLRVIKQSIKQMPALVVPDDEPPVKRKYTKKKKKKYWSRKKKG